MIARRARTLPTPRGSHPVESTIWRLFTGDDLLRPPSTPRPRWPAGEQSPEAEALRLRYEWDLEGFATHFFPHIFSDDFNALHRDYYQRIVTRQGSRGHRDATAAPRESSKTTGCASLGILHACAYHTEDFILYVTHRSDVAENKVRDIRDELAMNTAFQRIYGPQIGDLWNQGAFTTRDGVTVMAAGRQTQVRGITQGFRRFSKIIIDDVESEEHVVSEQQRAKDQVWLHQTIMRLGHARTNYEYWGTILHPQSLLATTLANPGWTRHFYQAVQRFAAPESVPLWQAWRTIFVDISNPQHDTDADAFFAAHREAMLADTAVLWPSRKSYYDLMKIRLIDGETSFWCELQNEPMGDARYLFDMHNAAYCDVLPGGIRRAGGTMVRWIDIVEMAAYIDCTPDKRDAKGTDYAACAVGMKDREGYEYLVDMFIEQVASTAAQIAAVVDLLWRWQIPRLGIEANSFQSLMVGNIREAIAKRAQAEEVRWHVDLIPIVNMRNKVLRIKSLESRIANGWLQFGRMLPAECLRQFGEYLPVEDAGHDDGPDATEGLVRVLNGLYEKKDIF